MELLDDWARVLREEAGSYARVALANLRREFPADMRHTMTAPGDFPYRPRARTPVFYGSVNWHSSVQMHWLLVRLLRVAGDAVPGGEIRSVLGARLGRVALAVEEEFVGSRDGQDQRPHGWGWVLALAHETAGWDDPDSQRWAAALEQLAARVGGLFLQWLPGAAYPVRHGTPANTAFGLSLALPYAAEQAGSGDAVLLQAITAKAHAWFGSDMLYPAGLEPSGGDALSPALAEAELMTRVLRPDELAEWLGVFLPGIEHGEPAVLFTPAVVADPADGDAVRLHGLNASRAWCWRRLAETLPQGDPRIAAAVSAARVHAQAVLPHATGGDHLTEHWLPACAVLMLS